MFQIGDRVRFLNRNSRPFYGDVEWTHQDKEGEIIAVGVRPNVPMRVGSDTQFRGRLTFCRRTNGNFVIANQKDIHVNRLVKAAPHAA